MPIIKTCILSAITIAVLIPVTVLTLWIITKAHKVQFHVIDANMTQFNLTDDSQLVFSLSVDMTVKNPNLRFGVLFDTINVAVLYRDIQISSTSLSPFYQGKKGATLIKMKFDGHQLVKLIDNQLVEFNNDKATETFPIKVELSLKIRVKIGRIKFKFKPKVRCGLKVPLVTRGRSYDPFLFIGCDVAY